MHITFNGHEAIIQYETNELHFKEDIIRLLTYTDRSKEYVKKQKGISKMSTTVCLYNKKTNSFLTGLLPSVVKFLYSRGIKPTTEKLIESVVPIETNINPGTRDYQENLVRTLLIKKRCGIQAPTASGKTWVASEFLRFFPNTKCLFIVPSSKDLMYQSRDALEASLKIPVGIIGDSKFKPERITVGLINTAANADPDFLKEYQVMVVDEYHMAGGDRYKKLSSKCINTDYRVGLSATAWRSGGDDQAMIGICGPIAKALSEKEMIKKENIVQPIPIQINFETPELIYTNSYRDIITDVVSYDTPTGKPDPQEVYKYALAKCSERNNLIVEIAEQFMNPMYPLPGVILVESIDQGFILKDLLSNYLPDIEFIYGDTPTIERNRVLREIQSGTRSLTIASRILNQGIDVTSIGYIILACGGSNRSTLIQQIGRACRKHPNKHQALIVDIKDTEKFYLGEAANKRAFIMSDVYGIKTTVLDSPKQLHSHIQGYTSHLQHAIGHQQLKLNVE